MKKKELLPYETLHNKLRKCNPLENKYYDYAKLTCSNLTTETALVEIRLPENPATGAENYSYLQRVWDQEKMHSLKDFLRWYNDKNIFLTLEATQEMVEFYHDKSIDMLKLRCILPSLSTICLHSSTSAELCPFTESDKYLLPKVRDFWLEDRQKCVHVKLLLMRLTSAELGTKILRFQHTPAIVDQYFVYTRFYF